MKHIVWVAAAVAVLAPMDAVLAQFSPGARSVGMGGAGMVFARGVLGGDRTYGHIALVKKARFDKATGTWSIIVQHSKWLPFGSPLNGKKWSQLNTMSTPISSAVTAAALIPA